MTRPRGRHRTTSPDGGNPADMPKVCATCHQRVYISRESWQHEIDSRTWRQQIWHVGCGRPK
jgi:hypothetical protein